MSNNLRKTRNAAALSGGALVVAAPFIGAGTAAATGSTFTVTPFGTGIGFFPIRDMSSCSLFSRLAASDAGFESYQMLQSTSPPTPTFTASRPVMTPRDVVRMLVPSPARTCGTSLRPK